MTISIEEDARGYVCLDCNNSELFTGMSNLFRLYKPISENFDFNNEIVCPETMSCNECSSKNIPCFGILGDLIISFSKLLDQKALNVPSRQHVMDDEYYKKIEAIQFTMNHDDGNSVDDIEKSDIILLGVSRTSKTPTSIYLANKGMKISNIPLVNEKSVPEILKKNPQKKCIVGLTAEPDRLVDLRKNRMQSIRDNESTEYTNLDIVQKEMEDARKLFQKYKWPSIDVTRKSVEETAASILKIHDIFNQK